MLIVFVHGWSVTDTSTYGLLPEALAFQAKDYDLNIEIEHIWLGRYISFHDDVTVDDIARGFNHALRDVLADGKGGIKEFSCITHSTGGPVVREWLERFYGANKLNLSPLRHLIMLAPANHGSALAALGKQRIGRIKAWFSGVEPGQRVLDWLSLGSQQQFDLAHSFINYHCAENHFFPFVLTGQTIDKKMYDFINSYLAEVGSDGVVRVAGANLNYSIIKLTQTSTTNVNLYLLGVEGKIQRPEHVPLGVIAGASHSGKNKGIMASIKSAKSKSKQQVSEILRCLSVKTISDYKQRADELNDVSTASQKRKHRYVMLVFSVTDDQGYAVNDYDLYLLGGESHDPDKLSKGFFVDRQQNSAQANHLTYYIDYDVVTKNKLTGFRVIARPSEGFSFYHPVQYQSSDIDLNAVLKPNETLYIQVELTRCVDSHVFQMNDAISPTLSKEGKHIKTETRQAFKNEEPSGVGIK